jgi:hypothetical protein
MKFRGPSDLAKVQGGYDEKILKVLKLKRGRAIDFRAAGAVISTRDIVYRVLGS